LPFSMRSGNLFMSPSWCLRSTQANSRMGGSREWVARQNQRSTRVDRRRAGSDPQKTGKRFPEQVGAIVLHVKALQLGQAHSLPLGEVPRGLQPEVGGLAGPSRRSVGLPPRGSHPGALGPRTGSGAGRCGTCRTPTKSAVHEP
jgi:hypothetical protein